jgi:putative colanic acid biosynthesis glycosyltransferase
MILLSIVTVTFKDPLGLERTLESLTPILNDPRVQLIVVDGAMQSHTSDTVIGIQNAQLISEPDDGIYDAMNKGLHAAKGIYTWFLNGGDSSLISAVTLEELLEVFAKRPASLFGAGYDLQSGDRVAHRRPRPSLYRFHALPTSHQALFFPTGPARESGGYLAQYTMSADYYLFTRLVKDGVRYRRLPMRVATFHAGGHSTIHAEMIAKDATEIQRNVLRSPKIIRLASQAAHWAARTRRSI